MNPSDQRRYPVTRAESVEEIRRNVAQPAGPGPAPTRYEPRPASVPASSEPVKPFRPTARPPLLLVCLCDDGQATGELHRVRRERFVIGRTEGDVTVDHDGRMSSRHLEFVRTQTAAGWRWSLRDSESTNGTFVRAGSAVLNKQQEFMIGEARWRFEPSASGSSEDAEGPKATQAWQSITPAQMGKLVPSLVQVTPQGDGVRHALAKAEVWIGNNASEADIVIDDPFVSPRHARVFVHTDGRMRIEDAKSLNGLWVRAAEVTIESTVDILAGEQRIIAKLLP